MDLRFSPLSQASAKTLIFLVGKDKKLSESAAAWDKKAGGILTKTLKSAPRFVGKIGDFFFVTAPSSMSEEGVIIAGLGDAKELTHLKGEHLGGYLYSYLNGLGVDKASVLVNVPKASGMTASQLSAAIAFGAKLKNYRFQKYHTVKATEKKPSLISLQLQSDDHAKAQRFYERLEPVASSVHFVRDLAWEPANVLYPETMAQRCKELSKLGVEVEVLGEKKMRALGMGSLLGVAQGSVREPQLIVLRWNGAPKSKAPLAFVGKGVTFDTGGISIKPADKMEDMKWDMSGSAVVAGLIRTLALRKAKVNAVGVLGMVENMPDGNAQRPGDVVTSYSGQTIEVINTDAEGRLVLADALAYTEDRFKPQLIVDLATLTGAIIICLGSHKAGLFSNNDKLASQLFSTGEIVGEKLWRLPLAEEYDRQIDSDIADMKNVGEGREAGSTAAAQFLQRFVKKTPWAHLDIASISWTRKDLPTCAKGATAFGLRLLDAFVEEHYE